MTEAPSLLIVDDNEAFRTRLATALERRGVDVTHVGTGEAAIDAATEASPEWALVDLRLPGIGGLDVVRALHDLDSATRIVVLTAYGSIATAVEAVRCGAAEYLQKPVGVDQIMGAFQRQESPTASLPTEVPSLARVEWEHIHQVLADCGGNIRQGAKLLGLHRRTLQRKLAKFPTLR